MRLRFLRLFSTNFLGRALAILAAGIASSAALALPAGFVKTEVMRDLTEPMKVVFAKDGRVFVAEGVGKIKVYNNVYDTQPTIILDIGSVGFWHYVWSIALHPNFPNTPHLYMIHTTPRGKNSHAVRRFILNGNTITNWNTSILFEGGCQPDGHWGADLQFGTDGALYTTIGDGATHTYTDWDQYDANICGDPWQEGGSLRAQDLFTTNDPVDYDGTVLRFNPTNGAALPNNPLAGGRSDDDRIIAYGLRNPFRFAIDPTSNEIYIGDVGWNTHEEINRVANPSDDYVENFGWPCYEGPGIQPAWQGQNLPLCNNLYNANRDTKPFYHYQHDASQPADQQASITALTFYTGNKFPTQYNNALFFADFSRNVIRVMFRDASGKISADPAAIQIFDNQATRVVDLSVGNDGALYQLDHENGKVYRISYEQGAPAKAVITAEPAVGAPGLTVKFDASGSTGENLNYAWDLDNDGQFDDSTNSRPSHTYNAVGTVIASVRVTDKNGQISVANRAISITNQSPVATIAQPTTTLTWAAEDKIHVHGSATDPLTGQAIPTNYLSWDTQIFHCAPNDATVCHTHPIEAVNGASGEFEAPEHPMPSRISVELRATSTQLWAQTWWNSDWKSRRWVFFNNLGQAETLNNFPVLLQLDASNIDYASAGSGGASLRFVASDNTSVLAHEIESWNPQGVSTVWVKIPSIPANSANSYIWMYYDNSNANNSSHAGNVWNNGFAGVWHMNGVNDSTSNLANGNNYGSTSAPGKIGHARHFNGQAYIDIAHRAALAVSNNLTLEAWVKIVDPDQLSYGRILSKKNGYDTIGGYNLEYNPASNQLSTLGDGPTFARADNVDLDINWHYVVASFNGNNARLYVDGVERTTDNSLGAITSNTLPLNIGRSAKGSDYFTGTLDEIRISNTNRSAAWIKAQHLSMSNRFVHISPRDSRQPLIGKKLIQIFPKTSRITVASNPPGLQVGLNSETGAAPLSVEIIQNAPTSVFALSPQLANNDTWQFLCWNDGDCSKSRAFHGPAADTTYTASFNGLGCTAKHNQMYLRGTFNQWNTQAMNLVAGCQWEGVATFYSKGDSNGADRFAFTYGNGWDTKYGASTTAGKAQLGGTDIPVSPTTGTYRIVFNDKTLFYNVTNLNNQFPIANAGADQHVNTGTTVTLDGRQSSDPDGTLTHYEWTGGLNGSVVQTVFDTPGTYTLTLTVTDNLGAKASDNVVITVHGTQPPQSTYPTMNLRGTHNNFGTAAMTLVTDYTWEIDATFPSHPNNRFKLDVKGDWTISFGDTDKNGVAEQNGADIQISHAGTYRIRFNDQSKAYNITCTAGCGTASWQRTVIFIQQQTINGQDVFMRGGLDWNYAQSTFGLNCAVDKWLCAIPIRHLNFAAEMTRANDKFLDWYGAELNQGNVQGSPLVWTTNNANDPKKVSVHGYGYTPLNQWGEHHWMLDVEMDCSKTANGWFELKAYVTNGAGWEPSITQPGAPYVTGNHFGQCGKINKFEWGSSLAEIRDLP
jgi:glucose/arabinose dehydrogenase